MNCRGYIEGDLGGFWFLVAPRWDLMKEEEEKMGVVAEMGGGGDPGGRVWVRRRRRGVGPLLKSDKR